MSKRRLNKRKHQSQVNLNQRPYIYDRSDGVQPIILSRWGKVKEFFDYYSCIIFSCIATIIYIAGIIWGFTIK